jgi:uncharacterized Tic20 family protein
MSAELQPEDYEDEPPLPTTEERTLGLAAHVGGFFGSFLVPMILLVTQRDKEGFAAAHSREALNYQIALWFYYAACFLPAVVVYFVFEGRVPGGGLLPALLAYVGASLIVLIYEVIVIVLASAAAWGGRTYRYPLNIRFV